MSQKSRVNITCCTDVCLCSYPSKVKRSDRRSIYVDKDVCSTPLFVSRLFTIQFMLCKKNLFAGNCYGPKEERDLFREVRDAHWILNDVLEI